MDYSLSKNLKVMLSNLCCSQCKNDFTNNSIEVIESSGDILICKLSCKKCGKDFGEIVLNYSQSSKEHAVLEFVDGPAPITLDDVIDAHEFIKNNL